MIQQPRVRTNNVYYAETGVAAGCKTKQVRRIYVAVFPLEGADTVWNEHKNTISCLLKKHLEKARPLTLSSLVVRHQTDRQHFQISVQELTLWPGMQESVGVVLARVSTDLR